MPYEIREANGQFCVAKQGESETMKCYDDKGKATAYLRALYANVHESIEAAEMHVVKARIKDGKMTIRMTSSDTGKDFYEEAMSNELFDDFIAHVNNEDVIPAPFDTVISEEEWGGGMPYMSIAHYKSGAGKVNVPGEITSIYRDGNVLKAIAVLYDTPLGQAVFKSLQKDLVEKRDDKVRVSIGFLDMEHSHGDKFTFTRKSLTDKCRLCKEGVGDKIYKKGHLVHLALTRVPANPRTDVEVEKSMTTKREDAESIIEDEEVIKGLDLKSQADDVLVIKMDKTDEDMQDCKDGDEDCKKKMAAKKKEMDKMHNEMSIAEPVQSAENSEIPPAAPVAPVPEIIEPTPVEKSFLTLKSKIEELKTKGLTGEAALAELQAEYNAVGETLKAEFTPAPTPPSPAEIEKVNLETTLRSLLGEVLDEKFQQFSAQTVAPMQAELETLKGELRAKSLTTPKEEKSVQTVQRSISPAMVTKAKEIVKQSQFDLIARQTVGLQ